MPKWVGLSRFILSKQAARLNECYAAYSSLGAEEGGFAKTRPNGLQYKRSSSSVRNTSHACTVFGDSLCFARTPLNVLQILTVSAFCRLDPFPYRHRAVPDGSTCRFQSVHSESKNVRRVCLRPDVTGSALVAPWRWRRISGSRSGRETTELEEGIEVGSARLPVFCAGENEL